MLLKTAIERIAPKDRPARRDLSRAASAARRLWDADRACWATAAASGVRLVISVDTGIRAFAAAAEAKALGLDLIVTDHHLPDDAMGVPEAVAVVNPAQEGCGYPFKSLCGAGVAFKLAHAILSAAAETEEERAKLRRGLIPSFLKLVAIATIADSVPLEGENRVIAALGLRELRNPVQPGLRALMQVAQIPANRPPTATEVGFRIAPRINAAGRMDIASDVVELFLTRDADAGHGTGGEAEPAERRPAGDRGQGAGGDRGPACFDARCRMESFRPSASCWTTRTGIAACWGFWLRASSTGRDGPRLC